MAGKKQLPPVRVATPDDAPRPPMSLAQAISTGSRLDELRALRVILVAHIENEETLARDLAALTRQLREISKEIETLELQESEEDEDSCGSSGRVADAPWSPAAI